MARCPCCSLRRRSPSGARIGFNPHRAERGSGAGPPSLRSRPLLLRTLARGERMTAERLSIRKIREVLRLAAAGHTQREIGRSLQVNHTTVAEYVRRAAAIGLSWPLPDEVDEAALERQLFRSSRPGPEATAARLVGISGGPQRRPLHAVVSWLKPLQDSMPSSKRSVMALNRTSARSSTSAGIASGFAVDHSTASRRAISGFHPSGSVFPERATAEAI